MAELMVKVADKCTNCDGTEQKDFGWNEGASAQFQPCSTCEGAGVTNVRWEPASKVSKQV